MDFEELNTGEAGPSFSDYFEPKQFLGNGSQGQVILAVDKETGNECAVKVVTKKKGIMDLKHETHILASLRHPNVVKCLKVKETKQRFLLAMEYLRGGTLKELIHERYYVSRTGFTDEEASIILRYILEGISYIHSKGFFHRDLKPENILFGNKDDFSSLKLVDFGLSAQYADEEGIQSFTQQCGTLAFMSPEIVQKKFYAKEVDIWSCGIIMYILLVGHHPLLRSTDNADSFVEKLINPKWNLEIPNFSSLAKNFFLKLVELDAQQRYTAANALSHPWITRRFKDEIPLSAYEKMRAFELQQTFIRVVKTLSFLTHLTQANKSEENTDSTATNSSEEATCKDLDFPIKNPKVVSNGGRLAKAKCPVKREITSLDLDKLSSHKQMGTSPRGSTLVNLLPDLLLSERKKTKQNVSNTSLDQKLAEEIPHHNESFNRHQSEILSEIKGLASHRGDIEPKCQQIETMIKGQGSGSSTRLHLNGVPGRVIKANWLMNFKIQNMIKQVAENQAELQRKHELPPLRAIQSKAPNAKTDPPHTNENNHPNKPPTHKPSLQQNKHTTPLGSRKEGAISQRKLPQLNLSPIHDYNQTPVPQSNISTHRHYNPNENIYHVSTTRNGSNATPTPNILNSDEAQTPYFISPQVKRKPQVALKPIQVSETQRNVTEEANTNSNLPSSESDKPATMFPNRKFSINKKLSLNYMICSHPKVIEQGPKLLFSPNNNNLAKLTERSPNVQSTVQIKKR